MKNINRGRTKITTRYIKNIGNTPIIFSLSGLNIENVDITFSIDNEEYKSIVRGKIDPDCVNKIDIQISVPRFGDDPLIELNLASRSVKNNLLYAS
jgi:hypothetical protein